MSQHLPGTLLHLISSHSGPVNAITFSALGGTYLLSGSSDRQIHLSRTNPGVSGDLKGPAKTNSPIQKYAGHGYAILDICCSQDNQSFASAGGDRSAFLWDVQTASTIRRCGGTRQGHAGRINTVCFAGFEKSVLVSGSEDRTVKVWDLKSRNADPIMTFNEAGDSITAVAAFEDKLITGSVDGKIRAYDIRMGFCTEDTMPAAVTSLDINKDGQAVLVGSLDSHLRLMDHKNGSCLQVFENFRNSALRIKSCLGRSDTVVISGAEDSGVVNVWDVMTGQKIGNVYVCQNIISTVKWREEKQENSEIWASAGPEGLVHIYGSP